MSGVVETVLEIAIEKISFLYGAVVIEGLKIPIAAISAIASAIAAIPPVAWLGIAAITFTIVGGVLGGMAIKYYSKKNE